MLQNTNECLVGIGSFRNGNSGECVNGWKTNKENKEVIEEEEGVIKEKSCHGIGNKE